MKKYYREEVLNDARGLESIEDNLHNLTRGIADHAEQKSEACSDFEEAYAEMLIAIDEGVNVREKAVTAQVMMFELISAEYGEDIEALAREVCLTVESKVEGVI